MSAMPAGGGRPDRRPPWLQHKHGGQPADSLSVWADKVIAILAGQRHTARHVPLGRACADPATARARKNALYAARDRYNRRRGEDERISLSANVADPATGQCRNCAEMGCQPSPAGVFMVHARVFSKQEGRSRQGAIPRDQWSYDPLAPKPRQHRAGGDAEGAAEPATRRRFGVAAGPDPAPARVSRHGAPPPSGRNKPGKPGDAQARSGEPQEEGILGRLRRTLG
jgi:hypothetical protein